MAIGTLGAIALGATALGSALSSKSQSKAASKAANAQTYAADQSAAVQREQLNAAQNALAPYQQRGNVAGDTLNALLGLGGSQGGYQTMPTQQPATAMPYNALGGYYGDASGNPVTYQPGELAALRADMRQQPQYAASSSITPQQAANSAFDTYRNSTGYQFRLGEGMSALNSGYAAAGVLQSGDAMKAAQRYGQDFASNEFGNYLGYLGNQQGVGLSGASALAGVGQNYANNISTINDSRASGIGNAALIAGNNNPFANALGMVGGGLFGYGAR